MVSILNKILSDLYTDKITIRKHAKVWELLDSFEYFPTSEDVLKACEIEKQSMRNIERVASIDTELEYVYG